MRLVFLSVWFHRLQQHRSWTALTCQRFQKQPDRWRIAAYIRALQLSQYAPLQALPDLERQQVKQKLGDAR